MAQTNRNFEQWLGRWFSSVPRGVEVSDRVQPVVVVDDTTTLQVPPSVETFGVFASASAVAAERSMVSLLATRKPLYVLDLYVTGVDTQLALTDGLTVALAGTALPHPISGGAAGAAATAAVAFGASATSPVGANAPGRIDADTLWPVDTLLLPGQALYFRGVSDNDALITKWVRWVELEPDSLATSVPRG